MAASILKKLDCRRGSTMILALVYVVVALTVGAMVLSSAYINLGHIRRSRDDQQDALAVSSGIRLARDRLGEQTLTLEYWESQVSVWHGAQYDQEGNVVVPAHRTDQGVHVHGHEPLTKIPLDSGEVVTLGGMSYTGTDALLPVDVIVDMIYLDSGTELAEDIPTPECRQSIVMRASNMRDAEGTIEILDHGDGVLGLDRYSLVLTLCIKGEEDRYTTTLTVPAEFSTSRELLGTRTDPMGDDIMTTTYWRCVNTVRWGTPTAVKGVLK